ncbi:GGDEF domain-containing protein [Caminibacter pacificus]|uniref:diguanylate cyclase n=1 Tax=Caminibacter pacificus TaxID=1424653 RepID=A0AAJ4REC1_9BACT|nr:GGDEF domain-containing protein [Caminibacter pacificus]QCI28129.1 GGDEF domain-containing protein [Caminibacter pacificus]ROR41160.1 diguanylate cyclase (GGDEF)-like protein [Caminibacter pacificus]
MKTKLFYLLLITISILFISGLEYTKNQKIVQINKQIETLKTPMHFLFNIQYMFNKAMLTKDKKLQLQYINTAEFFTDMIKNSQVIKNFLEKEKIKIKQNKVNPTQDTKNLYEIIKHTAESQYLNILNSLDNLQKYKHVINQTFIFIDISIIVLSVLIIILLENKRHKNHLEEASFKDYLTDTYNRRKFYEIAASLPSDKTHSLIMLDIDHFKQINDNYGHDKGDFVLKEVADIIRHNIRKNDYIFRWGGEEFIILLKNTDLEGGMKVVEKLKNDIESHDFQGLKITSSFGICETNKITNDTLQKLDEALYESKRKGRNRITVA